MEANFAKNSTGLGLGTSSRRREMARAAAVALVKNSSDGTDRFPFRDGKEWYINSRGNERL